MTPQFDASIQEVLEARAAELKTHMDDVLKRLELSAEVEIASGSPAGAILERADAQTLSVLGKEGEAAELGGSPKLGSTAERVVRRTDGAVLLVPRQFFKPERVLLGYDGSAGAEAALTYTLEVAQLLNVPVLALNAHEDEAAAQKQLETVRARAEREGLRLETEYRYGNPVEAILSATREGDPARYRRVRFGAAGRVFPRFDHQQRRTTGQRAGVAAPLGFAEAVDYSDQFQRTGVQKQRVSIKKASGYLVYPVYYEFLDYKPQMSMRTGLGCSSPVA